MKEKLITLGYLGNYNIDDIEYFLREKYTFNIRDIDNYINYGGKNCYLPVIELNLIPEGFFSKDYIKNETEVETVDRSLNLALDIIIRLNNK